MTVNGAPTAQIAIADVHRVDKDSTHQIGIVMRNFGDQGARITGRVIVARDHPQTHGFSAELAPRRDTTLLVPWDAPSKDVATDISISVDYGGGDTALWSSRLGGPPATVDTVPEADVAETPTSPSTAPPPTSRQPRTHHDLRQHRVGRSGPGPLVEEGGDSGHRDRGDRARRTLVRVRT